MLKTIDEAKQMICCGPPAVAWTKMQANDIYCAGPDCMAWRRVGDRFLGWLECPMCGGTGIDLEDADSTCDLCEGKKQTRKTIPQGYCGLAGKPE